MSIRIMAAILDLSIPPGPKLLLVALANNANEEGHAWPSQETLARKASATTRSVRSQTRALEAQGWLTTSGPNGRGQSIHYYLNVRKIKEESPDTLAEKAEVDDTKSGSSRHLRKIKAEVDDIKGGSSCNERRKLTTQKAEVGVNKNRKETLIETLGTLNRVRGGESNLQSDVPDYYKTLLSMPGMTMPLSKAEEWLHRRGISESTAEKVAYALKGKWDGKKWKDPYSTWQHWSLMEIERHGQDGRTKSISGGGKPNGKAGRHSDPDRYKKQESWSKNTDFD